MPPCCQGRGDLGHRQHQSPARRPARPETILLVKRPGFFVLRIGHHGHRPDDDRVVERPLQGVRQQVIAQTSPAKCRISRQSAQERRGQVGVTGKPFRQFRRNLRQTDGRRRQRVVTRYFPGVADRRQNKTRRCARLHFLPRSRPQKFRQLRGLARKFVPAMLRGGQLLDEIGRTHAFEGTGAAEKFNATCNRGTNTTSLSVSFGAMPNAPSHAMILQ